MNRVRIFSFFFLQVTILLFSGCEKDKEVSLNSVSIDNGARLLLYFEEQGDVINKIPLPSIQAEEVFDNINSYLILDIRDSSDFRLGHITGAKNLQKNFIFNYVKTYSSSYNKVVLVSSSGQSAAYVSSLLRIAGFSNIYYLNFGVASWNTFFSAVWTDRLNVEPEPNFFSYNYFPKSDYSPLPSISLKTPAESMKSFVDRKIESLINEGFDENYYSMFSSSAITYNYWVRIKSEVYTICTGPIILYISSPLNYNIYHLDGAILYQVPPNLSDFRSGSYLQSLPSKSTIAIYSGTGQESAFYTAYLRLLGYDARSILFGINNMDYNMLSHSSEITLYAFRLENVMNYPFVSD